MADDDPGELAPLYVAVLGLLDIGLDTPAIATALDLEIEAVPALVRLAMAKRAALDGGAGPTG